MSTCSFTYPRLTLVVMKLFVSFSLWHNPPFHSSKYADWLSEKRRKCKPYMLFWLVVSHDLSSGQTNPDLELQDCSTITLQSNTAALEALLVLTHCVTRTNTHRPCTRAHTCTLLYFLLSTYCSAKSSLFSYQTQAPTHTHAHLHTLSMAFLQLLLSILLSLSVS